MLLAIGLIALFGSIALGVVSLQGYSRERAQLTRTLEGASGARPGQSIDFRRDQLSAPVWDRAILPGLRAAGRIGEPDALVEAN